MKRALPRTLMREQPGAARETLSELGLAAGEVLDLATGLNPYGPPAALIEAARAAAFDVYPDATATEARERIAARFSTPASNVVLGNGAAELLWSCARVLLAPGTTVLAIEPGYPELSVAARQQGARVVRWRSVERTGHRVELTQIEELMQLENPDVVSLCAPGSPTGSAVSFVALTALADRYPDTQFVVDQSFLSLSDDYADAELLPADNMLCVRSLSKDFAVPGVRAGYLLAEARLCASIEATRPAFSTSAVAQAVVQAAMDQSELLNTSRRQLQADRQTLMNVLDQLGLVHTPSVAPFLLVRVARASEFARDLLTRHKIAVADCTPYGLPDHLRISACRDAKASRLIAALTECTTRRGLTKGRET